MAWGRWAAKVLNPKMRKLRAIEPVGEGGLFEVADAVDVEGDEVSGEGHVAGGVGVGGVGVVEEGRGEERGEEDDDPEAGEDEEGGGAAGGVGGQRAGESGEWFGEVLGQDIGKAFREGGIDHDLVLFQDKCAGTCPWGLDARMRAPLFGAKRFLGWAVKGSNPCGVGKVALFQDDGCGRCVWGLCGWGCILLVSGILRF